MTTPSPETPPQHPPLAELPSESLVERIKHETVYSSLYGCFPEIKHQMGHFLVARAGEAGDSQDMKSFSEITSPTMNDMLSRGYMYHILQQQGHLQEDTEQFDGVVASWNDGQHGAFTLSFNDRSADMRPGSFTEYHVVFTPEKHEAARAMLSKAPQIMVGLLRSTFPEGDRSKERLHAATYVELGDISPPSPESHQTLGSIAAETGMTNRQIWREFKRAGRRRRWL